MTKLEFALRTMFVPEEEVMTASVLYGVEYLETLKASTCSTSYDEALAKKADFKVSVLVVETSSAMVKRVIFTSRLMYLCPWISVQFEHGFLEGLDYESTSMVGA